MSTKHGGSRHGAGRKPGSGAFSEPTQPLRIPESLVPAVVLALDQYKARHQALPSAQRVADVAIFLPQSGLKVLPLPLFATRISAGFPSPADDYVEKSLDLNEYLVRHKEATFFLRVQGESMLGAGIHDGDMLIVDRAVKPQDGKVVVAALNGELTVKRLRLGVGEAWLAADNPAYAPIRLTEDLDCIIWGVVTSVIHAL